MGKLAKKRHFFVMFFFWIRYEQQGTPMSLHTFVNCSTLFLMA